MRPSKIKCSHNITNVAIQSLRRDYVKLECRHFFFLFTFCLHWVHIRPRNVELYLGIPCLWHMPCCEHRRTGPQDVLTVNKYLHVINIKCAHLLCLQTLLVPVTPSFSSSLCNLRYGKCFHTSHIKRSILSHPAILQTNVNLTLCVSSLYMSVKS